MPQIPSRLPREYESPSPDHRTRYTVVVNTVLRYSNVLHLHQRVCHKVGDTMVRTSRFTALFRRNNSVKVHLNHAYLDQSPLRVHAVRSPLVAIARWVAHALWGARRMDDRHFVRTGGLSRLEPLRHGNLVLLCSARLTAFSSWSSRHAGVPSHATVLYAAVLRTVG